MATSGSFKNYAARAYQDYWLCGNSYWQFAWTSTKTSTPGTTRVDWTLYSGDDSENHDVYARCEIKKDGVVLYDTKQNPYDFYTTRQSVKTGSFQVKHNASGAASFTISLYASIYYNGYKQTVTQTFNLDSNPPYGKCGAPTSVTITPTIQKPGGRVSVSWSGATGGTGGNSIKSYLVEYQVGNGSWVEIEDSTDTAASFTLPSDAIRGENFQVQVKTVGTIDGYDSGYTQSSAGKINTKPSKPTATYASAVIPSSGSRIVTVSSGSSNDVGQSARAQYKTSSMESYSDCPADGKLTITNATTLYLITNDGLETSDEVTISFTKNSKPKIDSIIISGTSLSSSNTPSGYTYLIEPTIEITRSDGQIDDNNTYTYTLMYKFDEQTNYTALALGSNKTGTLTIADIRTRISPNYENGYTYKISVVRNDGVEDSVATESSEYYVTKIPSPWFCNRHAVTSISGWEGYFYQGIRIKIPEDEGYDRFFMKILNSNVVKYSREERFHSNIEGGHKISDVNLSSVREGWTYYFQVAPGSASFVNNNYTNATNQETEDTACTKIKTLPGQDEMKIEWKDTLNPFVNTGGTILISNFLGGLPLAMYGMEPSNSAQAKAVYNQTSETISTEYEYNNEGFSINLSGIQCWNLFSDIGINQNSSVASNTQLSITLINVFGGTKTYTITKSICFVNNDTGPQQIEGNVFIDGEDFEDLNFNLPLYEGRGISLEQGYEIKSYHGYPSHVIITFLDDQSNEIFSLNKTFSEGQWDKDKPATLNTPSTYTLANAAQIAIFPENLTTNHTIKTISLTFSNGVQTCTASHSNTSSKIYYYYRNPIPILSNASYSGELISFTLGGDNKGTELADSSSLSPYFSVSVELQAKVSNAWVRVYTCTNGDGDYKTSYDMGNDTYSFFRIKTTTKILRSIDGEVIKERVGYSDAIPVYNVTPTLSYRHNKIGINFDFSKNADLNAPALVVGAHSGANQVYFKGEDRTIVFNISKGTVDGAIINCGSWDEI